MGLKFVKKQKQPLRRVLKKRCSGNMQQIYRRTPMPKYDLNKFAHFGMGVLRTSFPRNISEWLLLKFWKSNCLLVIFESENIFFTQFFSKELFARIYLQQTKNWNVAFLFLSDIRNKSNKKTCQYQFLSENFISNNVFQSEVWRFIW